MKINEPHRIAGLHKYGNNQNPRVINTEYMKRKDELSISLEAKEMLESDRLGGAERASQLAELKDSVASGTYHVEARQIADKLLPYLTNYMRD